MKQLFQLTTLATICLTTTLYAGSAEYTPPPSTLYNGYYLGGHGGASIPGGTGSGALQSGFDVGAQLGYRTNSTRAELAFSFFRNNLKNPSNNYLGMTTLMLNVYYDFNVLPHFFPLVGLGIGWLHSWRSPSSAVIVGPNSNEFAYQAIGGFGVRLGDSVSLELVYHFLDWWNGNGNASIVNANLNYYFK